MKFQSLNSALDRKQIQGKAKELLNTLLNPSKKIKNVDDMKSLGNLYEILADKTNTAKQNAMKLSANEENYINPSTGMYKLPDSLQGYLQN